MTDRVALAAARKLVPLSFFSDELAPILEAVDTRLAQLPEKCEGAAHSIARLCPLCNNTYKVYPAELVERLSETIRKANPGEKAVAVLDALNETP